MTSTQSATTSAVLSAVRNCKFTALAGYSYRILDGDGS
jgi:hypothetical protein